MLFNKQDFNTLHQHNQEAFKEEDRRSCDDQTIGGPDQPMSYDTLVRALIAEADLYQTNIGLPTSPIQIKLLGENQNYISDESFQVLKALIEQGSATKKAFKIVAPIQGQGGNTETSAGHYYMLGMSFTDTGVLESMVLVNSIAGDRPNSQENLATIATLESKKSLDAGEQELLNSLRDALKQAISPEAHDAKKTLEFRPLFDQITEVIGGQSTATFNYHTGLQQYTSNGCGVACVANALTWMRNGRFSALDNRPMTAEEHTQWVNCMREQLTSIDHWTKVFTRDSANQSATHSSNYPQTTSFFPPRPGSPASVMDDKTTHAVGSTIHEDNSNHESSSTNNQESSSPVTPPIRASGHTSTTSHVRNPSSVTAKSGLLTLIVRGLTAVSYVVQSVISMLVYLSTRPLVWVQRLVNRLLDAIERRVFPDLQKSTFGSTAGLPTPLPSTINESSASAHRKASGSSLLPNASGGRPRP